MNTSKISIDVQMDESRVPELITWNASDSTAKNPQKAKAMMLAFWDASEKTALRIDLWAKDMMVDEMTDFFYQTIMTMADTFGRATKYNDAAADMKRFAVDFYNKLRAQQLKENTSS